MTEYYAVIGTHSRVWGDKLLHRHVPDPFPQCGIGSGHARLNQPQYGLLPVSRTGIVSSPTLLTPTLHIRATGHAHGGWDEEGLGTRLAQGRRVQ